MHLHFQNGKENVLGRDPSLVKVEFEVSISKNPGLPKKFTSPRLPKWQNFLQLVFLASVVVILTDLELLLQQHQDNSMLIVTYKMN